MAKLIKNGSFSFPAGRYIVIDPCYIYPDEEWSELCDKMFRLDLSGPYPVEIDLTRKGSLWEYNGTKFFIASTCWGDGCYPLLHNGKEITCADGDSLGVDAGLLSLIPIELAQQWPEFEENKDNGIIIDVPNPFDITVSGDAKRFGDWRFDEFEVLTSGEDERD